MPEITMQDVRLIAGEGKLSAHDVLNAVNAHLRLLASPSGESVDWQPISTNPFVSGKRYLVYIEGQDIPFLAWRYFEGEWIAVGMNLKDHPPTHWMEMPRVNQSSPPQKDKQP